MKCVIMSIKDMARCVSERAGGIDINQYTLEYDELMTEIAKTIIQIERKKNDWSYGDEFPEYEEMEFWDLFKKYEITEEEEECEEQINECPRCSNGCNYCLSWEM